MNDAREPRGPNPADEALVRLLDEAAARESADMREAAKLVDVPGSHSVERVLAAQWGDRVTRTPRRSSWRLVSVALAAAAMVIVFFALRAREPVTSEGPSGQYLGGEGFAVLAPKGRVEAWPTKITWRADDLAREYVVQILDYDSGDVLLDLPRTIATEIDFPSEDAVAWPKVIEVKVTALRKDATEASKSSRVELMR